jgi:hypothetical protein
MSKSSPPEATRYFLIGAERSGTTVLRLMLDHHPHVAWVEEFEYAVERLGDDGTYPELRSYYAWLDLHRIFRASGFVIDANLDYVGLMESFMQQRQRARGKAIVGATVHRHFDRVRFLWRAPRYIYLYRDGRDVARSCIQMGWAGNVYVGVERWIQAETLWQRLRPTLSCEQNIEIRYESLMQQPTRELQRLCEWMGLEYDVKMLEYPNDTTYTAPDPHLAQQWQHTLSPRDVRRLEARIGDMLRARGYMLSGLPPYRVTRAEQAWLRVQDRLARIYFRMARFGLRLWSLDVLTRRLHWESARRRVQLQLDEIDTAHLK